MAEKSHSALFWSSVLHKSSNFYYCYHSYYVKTEPSASLLSGHRCKTSRTYTTNELQLNILAQHDGTARHTVIKHKLNIHLQNYNHQILLPLLLVKRPVRRSDCWDFLTVFIAVNTLQFQQVVGQILTRCGCWHGSQDVRVNPLLSVFKQCLKLR